jgi:hypothetical protein
MRVCAQSGQSGRLIAAICADDTGWCSGMAHLVAGKRYRTRRFRPRSGMALMMAHLLGHSVVKMLASENIW